MFHLLWLLALLLLAPGCGCGERETNITASGRVVFDDGTVVDEATVTASLVEESANSSLLAAKLARYRGLQQKPPVHFSKNDVLVLEAFKSATTTTDSNGNFSIDVGSAELPVDVLIEIDYSPASFPSVYNAKRLETSSGTANFDNIAIPNPSANELTVADGSAQTEGGALRVSSLPDNVSRFFARLYDPEEDSSVFPGEFAELASVPLNSTVFVWMEAFDASGDAVDELSQAATVRSQIPATQWADLEDITSGTNQIEIPIYTYDEDADMWEHESTGWLEDGEGTVLPEDAQSVILDGTFTGELFAAFTTNHLSWMNVDYAYIGPWTLSRMDSDKRNVDCLNDAMQLAETIAKSAKGKTAYAKVNKEGADLSTELADRQGPELKNTDLAEDFGEYNGDAGGKKDEFNIANFLWDGCGEDATDTQKKNTILLMAVTILHETAHWKDDVKKNPDDNTDTEGEEGNELENDLFGGVMTGNKDELSLDGVPVDDATRDGWLDPDNWPAEADGVGLVLPVVRGADAVEALDVNISLSSTTFELGAEIPLQVTYENMGSSSIQVMNKVVLEGWPLYFNIVDQATNERVAFIDAERKLAIADDDFTTLVPGETLSISSVNLVREATTSDPLYQLIRSGIYNVTAVYEELFGVAEATSNTLTITLNPGGGISGTVTNATNAQVISGATVKAMQGGNILTTATSDSSGNYSVAELPSGTYTFEVSASGFLKSTIEGVTVTAGQITNADFNISPLLTMGQIRLVLSWGTSPSDLDAHLWLPIATQYHLYYGRTGDNDEDSEDECPFAMLDVDDTDEEGPETITIAALQEGTYTYAVNRYSSGDLKTSDGQVQVFDSSGLLMTIDVPTSGDGEWWNVLTINGSTGAITEINAIQTDNPEPYADSNSGCS